MQQRLLLTSVLAGGAAAMPWGPPGGFSGFGGPQSFGGPWGEQSAPASVSTLPPQNSFTSDTFPAQSTVAATVFPQSFVTSADQSAAPTSAPAGASDTAPSASSQIGNTANEPSATTTPAVVAKPAVTSHQSSAGSTKPSPTPSGSGTSTGSASASSYSDIVVLHHNVHRANHSSPDIAWDSALAATAAKIAATCVFAHSMNVDGGGYGQNIAAGTPPSNISQVITGEFYNGEEPYFAGLYGQASPDMTNFEHWGHFSQLVWKASTKVGCATQDCTSKGGVSQAGSNVPPYFTVCNYGTPGNYAGEYAQNIGKSLGKPTVTWNYGLSGKSS